MPDKYELYDQAVDLVAEGKTEEAVTRYREAIALDADFADGWQGVALALNDLGATRRPSTRRSACASYAGRRPRPPRCRGCTRRRT